MLTVDCYNAGVVCSCKFSYRIGSRCLSAENGMLEIGILTGAEEGAEELGSWVPRGLRRY
jgi:hypothetical protein